MHKASVLFGCIDTIKLRSMLQITLTSVIMSTYQLNSLTILVGWGLEQLPILSPYYFILQAITVVPVRIIWLMLTYGTGSNRWEDVSSYNTAFVELHNYFTTLNGFLLLLYPFKLLRLALKALHKVILPYLFSFFFSIETSECLTVTAPMTTHTPITTNSVPSHLTLLPFPTPGWLSRSTCL